MTADDALRTVELAAALKPDTEPVQKYEVYKLLLEASVVLSNEVRRLRGENLLLNDLVKDLEERALSDARAEVAEGYIALEGACRDLDAEVRRLRELVKLERADHEHDRSVRDDECERMCEKLRQFLAIGGAGGVSHE